jgi:hypothetical protein
MIIALRSLLNLILQQTDKKNYRSQTIHDENKLQIRQEVSHASKAAISFVNQSQPSRYCAHAGVSLCKLVPTVNALLPLPFVSCYTYLMAPEIIYKFLLRLNMM